MPKTAATPATLRALPPPVHYAKLLAAEYRDAYGTELRGSTNGGDSGYKKVPNVRLKQASDTAAEPTEPSTVAESSAAGVAGSGTTTASERPRTLGRTTLSGEPSNKQPPQQRRHRHQSRNHHRYRRHHRRHRRDKRGDGDRKDRGGGGSSGSSTQPDGSAAPASPLPMQKPTAACVATETAWIPPDQLLAEITRCLTIFRHMLDCKLPQDVGEKVIVALVEAHEALGVAYEVPWSQEVQCVCRTGHAWSPEGLTRWLTCNGFSLPADSKDRETPSLSSATISTDNESTSFVVLQRRYFEEMEHVRDVCPQNVASKSDRHLRLWLALKGYPTRGLFTEGLCYRVARLVADQEELDKHSADDIDTAPAAPQVVLQSSHSADHDRCHSCRRVFVKTDLAKISPDALLSTIEASSDSCISAPYPEKAMPAQCHGLTQATGAPEKPEQREKPPKAREPAQQHKQQQLQNSNSNTATAPSSSNPSDGGASQRRRPGGGDSPQPRDASTTAARSSSSGSGGARRPKLSPSRAREVRFSRRDAPQNSGDLGGDLDRRRERELELERAVDHRDRDREFEAARGRRFGGDAAAGRRRNRRNGNRSRSRSSDSNLRFRARGDDIDVETDSDFITTTERLDNIERMREGRLFRDRAPLPYSSMQILRRRPRSLQSSGDDETFIGRAREVRIPDDGLVYARRRDLYDHAGGGYPATERERNTLPRVVKHANKDRKHKSRRHRRDKSPNPAQGIAPRFPCE